MNLSSLVHGGRQHQHQFFERYPAQYSASREQSMASSLVANPYTAQPVGQVVNYAYVSAPQAPPSPPIDETSKCSLPSISSLLGLADGASPEGSPKQQPAQQVESSPPSQEQITVQQQSIPPQHVMVDYRQNQTSAYDGLSNTVNMTSRGTLPPTPPMQMETGFDGRQSPSATSSSQYSVSPAPGYYFQQSGANVNSVEPHASSRQHVPVPVQRRATMPPQTSMGYQQSQFGPQYSMSPSQQSISSYYGSPIQQAPQVPQQQITSLYYQRPLPQQFPPPAMPVSVAAMNTSNGSNPWQHHHYISPSSQASFPQSQDRYICQTCQKAFSRPSSLRIHSHSHTGEKPFKCPHQGCGKAFSVRSNMKRHERGCHTFESHGSMQ